MEDVEPRAGALKERILRELTKAQDALIERNLRNKLVNCSLTSKRARQIRVVGGQPDENRVVGGGGDRAVEQLIGPS